LIEIIASFSAFKISQGSVATHLRWGGILINNFIANFQCDCHWFLLKATYLLTYFTECVGERIMKIGQYLAKIWTRVQCATFLRHGVYTYIHAYLVYWVKWQHKCWTERK